MINAAIRSIIDLLKLKKDVKKTDLEIEKLEREKAKDAKAPSVIQIASFDDIKKFDPRTRKNLEEAVKVEQETWKHLQKVETRSYSGGSPSFIGFVILAFLIYGLFKLLQWIWHMF